MPHLLKYHVEVNIDKLTNSILNTISGDSFPTDVHPLSKSDLKSITKKNKWLFDWKNEFQMDDREVFKLTIRNNPDIIQGLVSISDYGDHFYGATHIEGQKMVIFPKEALKLIKKYFPN